MDVLTGLGFASWTDNCELDTAYIECEPMSGGCVGPCAHMGRGVHRGGRLWQHGSSAHQFILLDRYGGTDHFDITCPADVIVVELDAELPGRTRPHPKWRGGDLQHGQLRRQRHR